MKKYLWMSSAAVMTGTLRGNLYYSFDLTVFSFLTLEVNNLFLMVWLLYIENGAVDTSLREINHI